VIAERRAEAQQPAARQGNVEAEVYRKAEIAIVHVITEGVFEPHGGIETSPQIRYRGLAGQHRPGAAGAVVQTAAAIL
jgi:hypothetical protein